MREAICIHIGQAGVQLSSTIWEIFCTEHGIQADGNLKTDSDYDTLNFHAFFQEIPSGQFVPRAISIDLEPTVLDEIRSGPYRKLFHPDQMVSGLEDAANNFARGHFTLGKQYIDFTINKIRKAIDICDALEGFFIFNSYGGGTGSGFSSLILERLKVEFTKKTIFQTAVFPGEVLSTSTVEPYNSLLCTAFLVDSSDLCGIFDNESLYNICYDNLDIPRPTYNSLNRIVGQIISSVTASIRFEGYLNAEMDQIITNLVPYPRIHFPIFTHAPLISTRKLEHQTISTIELTRAAFEPRNQLVSCNLSGGRYMCCCLQYRGSVTPREVNDALYEIKKRTDIKFVEWCPTSFKLGLNSQPPPFIPRSEIAQMDKSVTMLSNSTSIAQKFHKLIDKFDILFNKRSFLYWYVGEGMEEGEFFNARDEMALISSDYDELAAEDNDENENTDYLETELEAEEDAEAEAADEANEDNIREQTPEEPNKHLEFLEKVDLDYVKESTSDSKISY